MIHSNSGIAWHNLHEDVQLYRLSVIQDTTLLHLLGVHTIYVTLIEDQTGD